VGPDIIIPILNHSYINPRSPKPYLPYSLWPLSYYPVFLSKQTTTIPAIKIVCSYFKVPFLVVLLNSFYQSTFDWSNFINKQGPKGASIIYGWGGGGYEEFEGGSRILSWNFEGGPRVLSQNIEGGSRILSWK